MPNSHAETPSGTKTMEVPTQAEIEGALSLAAHLRLALGTNKGSAGYLLARHTLPASRLPKAAETRWFVTLGEGLSPSLANIYVADNTGEWHKHGITDRSDRSRTHQVRSEPADKGKAERLKKLFEVLRDTYEDEKKFPYFADNADDLNRLLEYLHGRSMEAQKEVVMEAATTRDDHALVVVDMRTTGDEEALLRAQQIAKNHACSVAYDMIARTEEHISKSPHFTL